MIQEIHYSLQIYVNFVIIPLIIYKDSFIIIFGRFAINEMIKKSEKVFLADKL